MGFDLNLVGLYIDNDFLHSLREVQFERYQLVSYMRARMRKFSSGLSLELILEFKMTLLIKDMDISRLIVHMQ